MTLESEIYDTLVEHFTSPEFSAAVAKTLTARILASRVIVDRHALSKIQTQMADAAGQRPPLPRQMLADRVAVWRDKLAQVLEGTHAP